jgi:hypothetical protein
VLDSLIVLSNINQNLTGESLLAPFASMVQQQQNRAVLVMQ